MIARLTRMEGSHDQIVLFTLVELMTHLIFLALILGLALRKEADPVYQQLVEKCGEDGSRCIAKPEIRPMKGKVKAGGIMAPSCRGEANPFVRIRALGDGSFAVSPLPGADAELAAHPLMRPLMRETTLTREQLRVIGEPIRKAANEGAFGGSCNITVEMCRAHNNSGMWDQQRAQGWYYFQLVGQNACR